MGKLFRPDTFVHGQNGAGNNWAKGCAYHVYSVLYITSDFFLADYTEGTIIHQCHFPERALNRCYQVLSLLTRSWFANIFTFDTRPT